MSITVLSVAEKPSVAKELSAIIGKCPPETMRRPGFSPYNHIFHIEKCSFKDQQVQMNITSVAGHMMELEFDPAYKSWNSCAPIELFTAPVIKSVRKDCSQIQQTLVAEAKKAQVLLLWLDCDLEGENIAFEVVKVCTTANPRLDVYRARFSALIERDILRTLRMPERPNKDMNDAVEARQEIDLRIGAAFTRFQTLRLQKRYEDITGVVSYGPCQFPTLGFVVERDLAIKRFQSEKFWYISCEGEFPHPDNSSKKMNLSFHWDRTRLYDHFAALLIYELCFPDDNDDNEEEEEEKNNNSNAVKAKVLSCDQNPTSKWRPVPLNTIEFQILVSRHLHMSSEKAMTIAEALYQRGIISYPRTETNFFKEGFELNTILQEFQPHSEYGAFTTDLLQNNKFEWPRHGQKDDQAHPPIHPTKSLELNSIVNEDERKIYDLIVRHFLASCGKDAKGNKTTVKIRIPAEDSGLTDNQYETFHTSGLMILEKNFLEIYSKFDYWNASKIPLFTAGDIFPIKSFLLQEGQTSPPAPISESELIAAMDKNGIGTDATIATHISTIQQREYAMKDARNCFLPTPLGLALIEGYNSMGYQLNKPFLRATMEADCTKVAKGEMTKDAVLKKCLSTMKECFSTCLREVSKLDASVSKYFRVLGSGNAVSFQVVQRNFTKCGQCQNKMELRVETNNNNNPENEAVNNREKRRYLFCLTCSKSHLLPPRGDIQTHDFQCPICHFQVLLMRNPETQKDHTLCPYCFNNPPSTAEGGQDGILQDFRCFQCAHVDCEFAGRLPGADLPIAKCINFQQCNGYMKLKKSATKGYFLACSSSTAANNNNNCRTRFPPKFVKSIIPQENSVCQTCLRTDANNSILKLLFHVNMSKAPGGMEPQMLLCPVCDPLWRRIDHPSLPVKVAVVVPPRQYHPPAQHQHHQQAPPSASSYQYVPPVYQNNVTPYHQPLVPPQHTPVSSSYISNNSHSGLMPPPSLYPSTTPSSAFLSPPPTSINVHPSLPSRVVNGFESLLPQQSSSSVSYSSSRQYNSSNVIEIEEEDNDYHMALQGKTAKKSKTTSSFQKTNNTNTNNFSGGGGMHQVDPANIPNCTCDVPTKMLTVNKEGANKGRPFFTCPRYFNNFCFLQYHLSVLLF
jgi:DNA topoisomerase-3